MLRPQARAILVAGLIAVLLLGRDVVAADESGRLFGAISIQGNTHTANGSILRELGFREGEPYDAKAVQRAWDHLEDLGFFAFVDIAEADETADGKVPLLITVEEEKTLRYYPLIDYDRRFKYRLGARVDERNLRGRGERLALEASWIRVHGYSAAWTRPWLANRRWLELGAAAGWQQAQFVYRPTKYSQWQTGLHARAWLRGRAYLEAGGVLSSFRQHSDVVDRVPGLPDSLWSLDHGWRNRLTPTLTIGLDTRDLEFYPTRGAWHRLGAQREISDGFDSYNAFFADLRQFLPIPRHKVIALHAYGRLVSGTSTPIPLEDRLYWGGPETIRGFRYASLEGEEGWLLSGELRWPLFLMPISPEGHVIGVGLHVFWDAGDAWYDGGHAHAPLMSWGGGAHINLSSLNLRFEIARTRLGENVFQFEDHFNF